MNGRGHLLLALLAVSSLFVSCVHEPMVSPGEVIPDGGGGVVPEPEDTCGPGAAHFEQEVLPIFVQNCTMSGWNDLNVVVANGRLAQAIQHQRGAEPMPHSGPMLSQCRISQVLTWIQDGAPNN